MSSKFGNTKSANWEVMRLKDLHIYKEDLIVKIIYNIKKGSPRNFYYFFIFFVLKILGNLILSHDYIRTISKDIISLSRFLRTFTFFNKFELGSNINNYDFICIAIALMVIIPLMVLFFIHKFIFRQRLKFVRISKGYKFIIRFCSVVLSIVILFSQHLIEILGFIFVHSYSISYINNIVTIKNENASIIKENMFQFFYNFESGLIFNKYFFIVVNLISILSINVCLYYYFVFINEPFLNSKSSIRLYHNKTYLFFLVLSFNLQAFHYLEFIFKEANMNNIRIILMIITLVIDFYFIINMIANYDFKIFYNNFLDMVFLICLISNILDIIVYYSYPLGIDNMQSIFKLIIEVIISVILNYSINQIKLKRSILILNSNLFSKNKKISLNSLFAFADLIQGSLGNSVNFLPIFKMIDSHKNACNIDDCPCRIYEFNNYLKNFDVNRDIKFLKDEEKLVYFKKVYHDILTLAENEIVNTIYQYYKGKEIHQNFNLFLLHVDYIFHFKRNHLLSNYLIEQYTLNIRSLPFVYKFYFYIYKKSIIKQNLDNIKAKQKMAINLCFYEFFKYYRIIIKIKKLMLKNCENFENLIYIKKTFDNNRLTFGNRDSTMDVNFQKIYNNIENIFSSCENLNKNYRKLTSFLKENFKTQRLKNVELSYILCNFFNLINKEIPFELRNLFLQIDSYPIVNSFTSAYEEKKMCHPLILTITRSDGFLIKYISQKLCDLIQYKKKELINEDIHTLIPQQFLEQHKTIIKKIIFLEYEYRFFKEGFLITKNQYYFPVSITSTFLPTINDNTLSIMDIVPIKNNKNNQMNVYEFILDHQGKFITFSRNFFDNFRISLEMFTKLKTSFCQFFNINQKNMMEKYRQALEQIQKMDISRTNSIMKIFQYIDLKGALVLLNEDNKIRKNYNIKTTNYRRVVDFIRSKESMIGILHKIKKKIQENEMDLEYMHVINEIEKIFNRNCNTNKLLTFKKTLSKTNATNEVNTSIPNNIVNFTNHISNTLADTETINNLSLDQFYIKFQLKNIGRIPFFYVQLYERKETNELDILNFVHVQQTFGGSIRQPTLYSITNKESIKTFSEVFKIDNAINTISDSNKDGVNTNNNLKTNDIMNQSTYKNLFSQSSSNKNTITNNNPNNNCLVNVNVQNNFYSSNNITNLININFPINNDTQNDNVINLLPSVNTLNQKFLSLPNVQNAANLLMNTHPNNLIIYPQNNVFSVNSPLDAQKTISSNQNNRNIALNANNEYNDFAKNNISNSVNNNTPRITNNINISANNNLNYINNKKNDNTSFVHFSFLNNPNLMSSQNIINLNNLNQSQNTLALNNSNYNLINLNNTNNDSSVQQLFEMNKLKSLSLNQSSQSSTGMVKKIADFNSVTKASNSNKYSLVRITGQQSDSQREKTIFIFLFLIISVQIFLAFFSFYFKSKIADHSFQLFNINYYALLTKLSIYYTSSSVISACSNVDIDPPNIDQFHVEINDYKKNFKKRSDELLTNMYKFMNFLSLSDSTQINEIMTIIDENISFKLLYNDWTSYYRNSSVLDEMSYYHYYIAGLQRPETFKYCRLRQYFYNQNFGNNLIKNTISSNNADSIHTEKNNENLNIYSNVSYDKGNLYQNKNNASFEESVLYYVVYNVFQVFRERLDLITKKINTQLLEYHNSSQLTLVIFNLIILFFALSLILIVIFSIKNYRRKILNMIFSIFIRDRSDRNFEERLRNFKSIVIDFDLQVCLLFEQNLLKINTLEFSQMENEKSKTKQEQNLKGKNSKGNKTSSNASEFSFNKKDKNSKESKYNPNRKFSLFYSSDTKNTNNYKRNKKFATGSNSINDSINNNNLNSNNIANNNNYAVEENVQENIIQQNLELGNVSMKIVSFSYLVLIIAMVFYLAISISNILINNQDYKKLILANQISVNFLDRIPKFAELILYYKISIIFNNVNFITTDPEMYANSLYSNFFQASYDINSDTLFKELGKSEYAHILYSLKIIRKNIDSFMTTKDPLYSTVLPSLRNYEAKINTQDFCLIYATYYSNLSNNQIIFNSRGGDIKEAFIYLNKETTECIYIGNGINKYGLNLAFESLLKNTNNLYLDFLRAKDQADITKTLTDINFLRTVLDVEYTLQKANSNYLKLILEEMTLIYESLKNVEYIYSLVGLFFNLAFLIFVIFGVLKKMQKYYFSLYSAIEKFRIALVTNNLNILVE